MTEKPIPQGDAPQGIRSLKEQLRAFAFDSGWEGNKTCLVKLEDVEQLLDEAAASLREKAVLTENPTKEVMEDVIIYDVEHRGNMPPSPPMKLKMANNLKELMIPLLDVEAVFGGGADPSVNRLEEKRNRFKAWDMDLEKAGQKPVWTQEMEDNYQKRRRQGSGIAPHAIIGGGGVAFKPSLPTGHLGPFTVPKLSPVDAKRIREEGSGREDGEKK